MLVEVCAEVLEVGMCVAQEQLEVQTLNGSALDVITVNVG
jgi:hypothetical protein